MGPAAIDSRAVIRGVLQAQTDGAGGPFLQLYGYGQLALGIHFFGILEGNHAK